MFLLNMKKIVSPSFLLVKYYNHNQLVKNCLSTHHKENVLHIIWVSTLIITNSSNTWWKFYTFPQQFHYKLIPSFFILFFTGFLVFFRKSFWILVNWFHSTDQCIPIPHSVNCILKPVNVGIVYCFCQLLRHKKQY